MTLEQLQQQLDAMPPDDALPASTTRAELAAHQAHRHALDGRLVMARSAMAALAELTDTADVAWLDHLNAWRRTLCDELLTIKSPIRDPKVMGLSQNLTLSIRAIDFGAGQLREGGWTLENSRLGQLMVASGFEPVGADLSRHYVGTLPWHGSTLPWHGSTKEVEARLKRTAQHRAQARQRLDSALMDDDERAKQEAEAKKFRDALNSMDLRGPNLDVLGRDESELTPLQQEALAWARRASRVEPVSV